MNKPTLLDTQLAKQLDLQRQLKDAAVWIVKNINQIKLSEKNTAILLNTRNHNNSSINQLFEFIQGDNKLSSYLFMNFKTLNKQIHIPEILTMSAFSISGLDIGISSLTGEVMKMWCNITPHIRLIQNERIEVTDINAIQELIVLGALCRSYNNSGELWLQPNIAAMVIESYALTISGILSSAYKLSIEHTHIIMTLFSMYFAHLLSPNESKINPPLLLKSKKLLSLGVDFSATSFISKYREDVDKNLTIEEICQILRDHGPVKLVKFSTHILSSLFAKGVNVEHMLIALQYPPYYVMQLIKAADGYKNYNIASIRDNKKYGIEIAKSLLSKQFTSKI